jgi:MATE family multidrug resistance protein
LHLVSFSAFFLDGFAFAAESLVGAAVGARSRSAFDAATRRSSELAIATAFVLALLIGLFGDALVALLTTFDEVRALASQQVLFAAIYVIAAVAAFQLDGIFIGATRTRAMRNAALLSMAAFLALGYPLVEHLGNTGLWLACIGFAAARGVTLGWVFPTLRASVGR